MNKEIHTVAIVGAGGMGGLFGSILSKGGLEVTLIDTNREQIEAIRANGLSISGFGGKRNLMLPTVSDASLVKQADIVLVQCKGTATREAALSMTHLADNGSIFISFQNGLGNEDILAEILIVKRSTIHTYIWQPRAYNHAQRLADWLADRYTERRGHATCHI